DQPHRERRFEPGERRVMVDRVAVDGATTTRLDRLPFERAACPAARTWRVAPRPARRAVLYEQLAAVRAVPEERSDLAYRRAKTQRFRFLRLARRRSVFKHPEPFDADDLAVLVLIDGLRR